MAASNTVPLHRISLFRAEYYNPVGKYSVDIWGQFYLERHKSKIRHYNSASTEMEFLDISLTKDSSFLLPFYWRILIKTILFSGFKNPHKKIRRKRKLESIHE
jgi:hypothetical protein